MKNEIDTIEYFDLFAPCSLFLHAGGYPGCGGGKEQILVALSQEIAGTQKEIVYFDEKLFIDAQTIGDRLVSPFLDEEVWKRAIQPDQYTSPNEPYVYSTHESVQTLENGKIHQSFRIMREPNQFPELPNVPERPEDTLEGELRSQIDRLAETGEKPPFVRAHIKLHGLPRFNVPARADSPALSQQQKEILKQQRLDVFEERKVLFRNAAESLKTEIR